MQALEAGEAAGAADARMPREILGASARSLLLSADYAGRERAAWRVGYLLAYLSAHPIGCDCGCGQ